MSSKGLAARVAAGLQIVGIPTSERTAAQARRLGIPLASFAEYQKLDLTIDGADEVELGTLNLIKGLGGALLREKIVAAASRRLVIVVDQEKLVERLGDAHAGAGRGHAVRLAGDRRGAGAAWAAFRSGATRPDEHAFITDGGNYILDCRFGRIADPGALEKRIAMTVGTVENGLFVGRSSIVVVASATGIEVLIPPPRNPGMRKISLVISDVDGTLVTTGKRH